MIEYLEITLYGPSMVVFICNPRYLGVGCPRLAWEKAQDLSEKQTKK
jgi:hypothetical protein